MQILNQTKHTRLAQEADVADSLFSRLKGLLARKELPPHRGLILKPCNSIHTFFMQFPIDVLFVDTNGVVIAALPDVKPFRLSSVYWNARCVVEVPAGTIAASSTAAGDILAFE